MQKSLDLFGKLSNFTAIKLFRSKMADFRDQAVLSQNGSKNLAAPEVPIR